MVQSGDAYRKKNRKRLQRFYERQKAKGKKRISLLLSANAYTKLRSDRDNTGSTLNAIVEKAILEYGSDSNTVQVSDDVSRRLKAEKDRTGMSSEIIEAALNQRHGGQGVTQSRESETQPPAAVESADTGLSEQAVNAIDDLVQSIDRDQAADDTDQDQAELAALDDLIPDCTGREITIEERDKYLLLVADALPGRSNAQARVDLLNKKKVPVSVKPATYGGEWDRKKVTDNLPHAKKRLGIK